MDWSRLKESFSQLKENNSQVKSTTSRTKSILRQNIRDNSSVTPINRKRRKLLNKNYCKLNVSLNGSQKSSKIINEDLLELCTGNLDDYNLNSTSIKLNADTSRNIHIKKLEFQSSPDENTRLQVPKSKKSLINQNLTKSDENKKSFKSINHRKVLGNSNWNSILSGSKLYDHDESILKSFNEQYHLRSPLINIIAESDDSNSNDTLIGSQTSVSSIKEHLLIEDDGSNHSNETKSSSDLLKSFCSDDSLGDDDDNLCIIDDSEKINEIISSAVAMEGGSQKSISSLLESNNSTQKSSNKIEYFSSISLPSSNLSNATLIDLFPSPSNDIDQNNCTDLDLLVFDIQKDLNKHSNSKRRKVKGGYLDKLRKTQKANQSNRIFWINELENGLIQPSNMFKIVAIKETYNIQIVSIESEEKFKHEIIINKKSCNKNSLLVGNYINVEFDYDSYEVNSLKYVLGVNKYVNQ